MRSMQWLGLSLTAVLLLLCGCSVTGGGSPQPPSALSYATSTAVYTVGMAITPDNPTSTGGAVSSYSVSPDLPAGLSLSTSTGAISGTPTVVTATAGYTVTAANSLGSAAAILTITVNGAFPAQAVPNMGQQITPLAPPGALFGPLDTGLIVNGNHWLAGQAVSTAVSPDGNTLLILTSGYNLVYNLQPSHSGSGLLERVRVHLRHFGAHAGAEATTIADPKFLPRDCLRSIRRSVRRFVLRSLRQHFYVPGIIPDDPSNPSNRAVHDFVHVFTLTAGTWAEEPSLAMPLNHTMGNGLPVAEITNPNFVRPFPAGVAVSRDCRTLVVANYSNDTITVFKGGYPWSAAGNGNRPAPRQGQPRAVGHSRRRISVVGAGDERRIDSVCIQHSRSRDRRSESERDGGGNGPDPGKRPARQDDDEPGPDAAVRRRRPVGYGGRNRHQPERHQHREHGTRNHPGHRSPVGRAFRAGAIYRRQPQQRDALAG